MAGIPEKAGGMLEEGGYVLGIIFSPLSTKMPILTFATQNAV